MIKRNKRVLKTQEDKICNICGEMVKVYSVSDNAIVCEDCVPTKRQKILSEATMMQQILKEVK